MLKVFRDNLKYLSWILWLVIGVFILFVFADFGGIQPGRGGTTQAAAKVGSLEISYSEFEGAYRRAEEVYRQAYGGQFSRETANAIGLPMQVLDQLVNDRILLLEADRMGLEVTDKELRKAILEIPALKQNGHFIGEQAYKDLLRANRMTVDQFEDSFRSDLLIQKLRSILEESIYVADGDVEEAYRSQAETAKIRYLRLPSSRFAADVVVGDDELAAYFEEHREAYRLPERRVVEYLLVSPQSLRDEVEVGDDDVQADYDSNTDLYQRDEQVHARHILIRVTDDRPEAEAETLATELRSRIEAGEDFAALAAEYSDDPGTREKGGDLGFFGRGEMVQEFEQAAFSAAPGDIVGPVRSTFGYHIIEVLERRPAGLQPLDEVRDQIVARLTSERAAALAESRARDLVARIRREKPDATGLEGMATEAGATFATTEPFGREDNIPGIGRETPFTVAAFELEEGTTSDPVRVGGGWAVLRLVRSEEPRIPELDEVKVEVERKLRTEKQLEIASQRLAAARQEIGDGRDLEAVGKELDLSVEEAGPFSDRAQAGPFAPGSSVAREALTLAPGDLGGPVVAGNDAVLFEVVDRTYFDATTFDQKKDETRQRLESERFGKLMASLLALRRQELSVSYDPRVLENFGDTAS